MEACRLRYDPRLLDALLARYTHEQREMRCCRAPRSRRPLRGHLPLREPPVHPDQGASRTGVAVLLRRSSGAPVTGAGPEAGRPASSARARIARNIVLLSLGLSLEIRRQASLPGAYCGRWLQGSSFPTLQRVRQPSTCRSINAHAADSPAAPKPPTRDVPEKPLEDRAFEQALVGISPGPVTEPVRRRFVLWTMPPREAAHSDRPPVAR